MDHMQETSSEINRVDRADPACSQHAALLQAHNCSLLNYSKQAPLMCL